ncbi:MAG: class I SAM-dependent methyltransferase [Kineosporiaceae bacterium]
MTEPAFYERTAEYVAVLLGPPWQVLGPALAAALEGLDPAAGPVVDVGAGSGLGTRVIAQALPGAEIIAIEPDRALRTALLATVIADPELRSRVTVEPCDLLATSLPPRLGAIVALNVLGHFPPADRCRMWRLAADRLAPGGVVVVDLAPPNRPEHVAASPMGEVVVGRHRYTGTARAEPAGDDAVTWEMSYRVTDDQDRVLADFSARQHWHVLDREQLAAEVAGADLHLSSGHGGLLLVHR